MSSSTSSLSSAVHAQQPGNRLATGAEVFLLVSALLLAFVSTVGVLITFWPAAGGPPGAPLPLRFAGIPLAMVGNEEGRSFVLVLSAGALGAFVHAANSASDFIGGGKLMSRWLVWYLLRMPVGASLALLLYLLLRGGVLTGGQVDAAPGQQPYGIIGLSALAGMFSGPATAKLAEVFETLFRTSNDPRTDKLQGDRPLLKQITPTPLVTDGVQAVTITLKGESFKPGSLVLFGQQKVRRTPKYIDETELQLELTPADLAAVGEIPIAVETTGDRPGASDAVMLIIQRPPAQVIDDAKQEPKA